jgi:hypothetical protein
MDGPWGVPLSETHTCHQGFSRPLHYTTARRTKYQSENYFEAQADHGDLLYSIMIVSLASTLTLRK